MALGEWVSLLGCAQKSAGEPESPPPQPGRASDPGSPPLWGGGNVEGGLMLFGELGSGLLKPLPPGWWRACLGFW